MSEDYIRISADELNINYDTQFVVQLCEQVSTQLLTNFLAVFSENSKYRSIFRNSYHRIVLPLKAIGLDVTPRPAIKYTIKIKSLTVIYAKDCEQERAYLKNVYLRDLSALHPNVTYEILTYFMEECAKSIKQGLTDRNISLDNALKFMFEYHDYMTALQQVTDRMPLLDIDKAYDSDRKLSTLIIRVESNVLIDYRHGHIHVLS